MATENTVQPNEKTSVIETFTDSNFEVTVLKVRSRSARLRGEAFVDGVLVAEAELFSSMVDRDGTPQAQVEVP